MKIKKTPSQSKTIWTELVLPNDTNNINNLFGGALLSWLDKASSVTAQKHCGYTCVTAAVNNVAFTQAIPIGSVVTLESKVSRSFGSSMEIVTDVYVENTREGTKTKTNEAIFTFVAVNDEGKPQIVPELVPETEEEKVRFAQALRRRQLSLIIAGKMQPENATELKNLFFN